MDGGASGGGMSLPQPWRDQAEMLAALRALGVQEYVSDESGLARVVFFPAAPPAVPADERPLPRPERTLDEKLFDPLGIGKKDGKG
jgi:hypothetical protein